MQTPQPKVSPVALEVPVIKGRSNWRWLILMGLLMTVAGICAFLWMDPFGRRNNPHETQWPRERDEITAEGLREQDQRGLEQMQALADALLRYREQEGGGVRWPTELAELTYAGILPAEHDFRGAITGQPITYQPDPAPGVDPARWVMCADVQQGWTRSRNTGRRVKTLLVAAVVLGDGTARLISADEAQQYVGLPIFEETR
jgi:hypothetical protein